VVGLLREHEPSTQFRVIRPLLIVMNKFDRNDRCCCGHDGLLDDPHPLRAGTQDIGKFGTPAMVCCGPVTVTTRAFPPAASVTYSKPSRTSHARITFGEQVDNKHTYGPKCSGRVRRSGELSSVVMERLLRHLRGR
jgi:hypothetical protein